MWWQGSHHHLAVAPANGWGGVMKIGIIGAGNIGGTLARRLAALGHQVSIANSRGPETLAPLANEIGAKAVTVEQAARAGEVVILSIPLRNVTRLPALLFDGVPDSVVVVDTGNYYPRQRDGRIEPIENGTTESRWVSDQLGRPVVKVFNSIYAQHLAEFGKPKEAPDRFALPVAGDDKRAKDIVIRLLDELGFDGVDAGGLDDSWRQQPGTPVYGADLDTDGVRRALVEAKAGRQAAFSGTADPEITAGR
jgi:predicted dinucleotide-binding enzyme